jgi:hypothetical protein
MDTAQQLQHRLSPNVLARDAWDGAKEKGASLAEEAVDAVKARPLTAGGVVAALAMFLAREPLMDLAGQLADTLKGRRKARRKPRTKSRESDTETVE